MDPDWSITFFEIYPETSGSHSSGAIGPLFVVLAIITILGVLAGLVSRVCGGRHWSGETEYNFEGWVERRCASCIDGDLETGGGGGGGGGAAKPVETGSATAPPPAPEQKPPEEAKPAEPPAEAKPVEGGEAKPAEGEVKPAEQAPAAPAPAGEAKPAEGGGEAAPAS